MPERTSTNGSDHPQAKRSRSRAFRHHRLSVDSRGHSFPPPFVWDRTRPAGVSRKSSRGWRAASPSKASRPSHLPTLATIPTSAARSGSRAGAASTIGTASRSGAGDRASRHESLGAPRGWRDPVPLSLPRSAHQRRRRSLGALQPQRVRLVLRSPAPRAAVARTDLADLLGVQWPSGDHEPRNTSTPTPMKRGSALRGRPFHQSEALPSTSAGREGRLGSGTPRAFKGCSTGCRRCSPRWRKAETVFVVEGEKDADTAW